MPMTLKAAGGNWCDANCEQARGRLDIRPTDPKKLKSGEAIARWL
jgi:hypothetical protein